MTNEPSTRDKIIQSAEILFAEKGPDGASLREITQAAGVNLAAVNYHFQSKEGLLEVVLQSRLRPINELRLQLLADLEEQDGLSVEAILGAFVSPALDPKHMPTGHFVLLMARLHHAQDAACQGLLLELLGPVLQRLHQALGRVLPALSNEELSQRMQFVVGAMIHSLFHHCAPRGGHKAEPLKNLNNDQFKQQFISFCAAGLKHA